ncbi:MAG: hypothetical protein IMW85_02455 [Thermicanus sp.]|nr:hypothetical protein [Thermicanus sp.]
MNVSKAMQKYILEKIDGAKLQFERTIECKHTEFDDLYPYMGDHPQFFWYKRYVAWTELITYLQIARELEIDWEGLFTDEQRAFLEKKVLEGKVLNDWFGSPPPGSGDTPETIKDRS